MVKMLQRRRFSYSVCVVKFDALADGAGREEAGAQLILRVFAWITLFSVMAKVVGVEPMAIFGSQSRDPR